MTIFPRKILSHSTNVSWQASATAWFWSFSKFKSPGLPCYCRARPSAFTFALVEDIREVLTRWPLADKASKASSRVCGRQQMLSACAFACRRCEEESRLGSAVAPSRNSKFLQMGSKASKARVRKAQTRLPPSVLRLPNASKKIILEGPPIPFKAS